MRELTATNSCGNNGAGRTLRRWESVQFRKINSTNDCDFQMEQDDSENIVQQRIPTDQHLFADDARIQQYVYDDQQSSAQASSSETRTAPYTLLQNPSPNTPTQPYPSHFCTSSSSSLPPPYKIAFATSSCHQADQHRINHCEEPQQDPIHDSLTSKPSLLSQLQDLLLLSCLQHHNIQTLILHLTYQQPIMLPPISSHHLNSFSPSHGSVSQKLTELNEMVNSIDVELLSLKTKTAHLQQQLNAYHNRREGDDYSKHQREKEKKMPSKQSEEDHA